MCVTSLGRSYGNVCDIVRNALRGEKNVQGDVSIRDSFKKKGKSKRTGVT
jgi:hypothetical protein